MSIAAGSLSEIDTLIEVLSELEFIAIGVTEELYSQIDKVSALLTGLQKYIQNRIK